MVSTTRHGPHRRLAASVADVCMGDACCRSFKKAMESSCVLELRRKRYSDVNVKVHRAEPGRGGAIAVTAFNSGDISHHEAHILVICKQVRRCQ